MTLPEAFLTRPIAHRAWHDLGRGRPENSLAAVRAAVEAGYGIEIDVQPSLDGVAMVFHDDDLERLAGEPGPVWGRAAEVLAATRLLGTDETVPTLATVLAAVAGRVPLLIELKHQTGDRGDALAEAVARDLEDYDGPVALMSFDPEAVARMARLLPERPRGLTTCAFDPDDWKGFDPATLDRLRAMADFDRVGASFISHHAIDLDRPRVAELKARGVPVLCWTIRSPEAEAAARRVADNVTFESYPAALSS